MTARWSAKDPQDVRDYWIDFTLLGIVAPLTAATVTVPDDQDDPVSPFTLLAIDDQGFTGAMVRARFSGGSVMSYPIQYHVTDSTGQEFDLTKTLIVKERTA